MQAKLAKDAPGLVHGPTHLQAADEFPAAFADLREPAPQTEAARKVDPLVVEWLKTGLA